VGGGWGGGWDLVWGVFGVGGGLRCFLFCGQ